MPRGFRARLSFTIIGLVVVTATVLSVTSFVLVRTSLRNQLIEDGLAQADFNVLALASERAGQLPVDVDRSDFEASGLAERFLTRGTGGVYVDFGDDDPYASRPDLLATPSLVSSDLLRLVTQGRFAYEFTEVSGSPTLVVGARRPPGGPDFYFFTDAGALTRALADLWRFLAIGVGLVVGAASLAAGTVSRRVLRPVTAASAAARRLAAGDLGVRLDVDSDDEFGQLTAGFNSMAASLEQQVAALEEEEAKERRFVADVSHELRTPLTGLVNEAHLLDDHKEELTGVGLRAAELLIADVGRLRHLVEELLEISRLGSAVDIVELVETDIGRFLEAVIEERLPTSVLVNRTPERVVCDRRSLERVVANLLDNAHIHAPGSAVSVSADVEDGALVIVVCDDGPGVEPEHLDRLFDRFFKADSSRQGGTGLGLAIAREHARRMGGELRATSVVGSGVRFELRIPVTQPLHGSDVVATYEAQAGGDFHQRRTS